MQPSVPMKAQFIWVCSLGCLLEVLLRGNITLVIVAYHCLENAKLQQQAMNSEHM